MYLHPVFEFFSTLFNEFIMKKLKLLTGLFLMMLLSVQFVSAQENSQMPVVSIIPEPVSLSQQPGSFTVTPSTTIYLAGKDLDRSSTFLNEYLQKYYGFHLKVKKVKSAAEVHSQNAIVLDYHHMGYPIEGAYTFLSDKNGVKINGDNGVGVFYGIQTLIQLLPTTPSRSLEIARVTISDHPRFKYRGMMLDCGRHFFDTAFVKKFINFIALHKMNRFHWHLTDDQGWRIQIKKYPRLTSVGAWRDSTLIGHYGSGLGYDHTRYGGFYTQDEIKAIVKYAQERYITIIPEIEMPGHSTAAIAAYPELSCGSPKVPVGSTWGIYDTILCPSPYTFHFYENVLDEVMKLFPSHYIHIGGDETPEIQWKNSPYCQALLKRLGDTSYDQIHSYFITTIEKYLNKHGRDIIGWDEILEGGLAPNATVMSWRGESGGIAAAKMHHNVIMTPGSFVYLDHAQAKPADSLTIGGYLPLERVYNYNPVPQELTTDQAKYIEGVQANVWTEYMQWPTKVEYMIFPRMEAVSEAAWTPVADKNYDDFLKRLQTQYQRYKLWGVSYYKGNEQ